MLVKEKIKPNVFVELLSKVTTTQLFWIVSFSILTVFAAQVSIPIKPVPFTLQTMLVILSGAFLGARNGAISQILYLTVGAIGLPVFANFSLGIQTLFGPTGGYLIAFPVAAFLVGSILEKKRSLLTISLAMILGTLTILLSGAAYLSLFFDGNFNQALLSGVLIFSLWDIVKISAAVSIYYAFSKKYPKLPA
ncbi:MAG: biotin transporter BioY [Melioribacteraceae bacterium]|nr:biotin transporter BioY [Melioribacteraceae bacterium]WKZ68200.1 MAG: biotin transporter BioY [Melioribacteraceae bacterium]